MKQKLLLLMVLALGMCSINGSAQTKNQSVRKTSTQTKKQPVRKTSIQTKASTQTTPKESRQYQVENDGFEWYQVKRTVNGQTKYGAEDRNGNMIIPTEYDLIWYPPFCADFPQLTGFEVHKGEIRAWYSKSGKCIIPYTRGYTSITKQDEDELGTHYQCAKTDIGIICDRNGKEVVSVKADGLWTISIDVMTINGKKHYYLPFVVKKNGEDYYGIADVNGRIIVPAEYKGKDYGSALKLAENRLTTTNNPLESNSHETQAEEGRNTTSVVQQERLPVPTQEWETCYACHGSGICQTYGCDNGWNPNTRMHCLGCGGSGRCSSCAGRGGRNVTVLR